MALSLDELRGRPVALLFPGQGAQAVGMARGWPEAMVERAGVIPGLLDLMAKGPQEELTRTINAQPALYTVSLASLEALLARLEGHVVAVAGHSVGEFAALAAAKVLSFEEGLLLVRRRGELMSELVGPEKGGMLSVLGLGWDRAQEVARAAGGRIAAACYNGPDNPVFSGEAEALERASRLAKEAGARIVVPVKVELAFHSPLLERAKQAFAEAMAKVNLRRPQIPFISNHTGEAVDDPEEIRAHLIAQITSPVLWSPSVQALRAKGAEALIELAPGKILTSLARKIDRSLPCLAWEEVGRSG